MRKLIHHNQTWEWPCLLKLCKSGGRNEARNSGWQFNSESCSGKSCNRKVVGIHGLSVWHRELCKLCHPSLFLLPTTLSQWALQDQHLFPVVRTLRPRYTSKKPSVFIFPWPTQSNPSSHSLGPNRVSCERLPWALASFPGSYLDPKAYTCSAVSPSVSSMAPSVWEGIGWADYACPASCPVQMSLW